MNFLAHCLIPDLALPESHPDLVAGGFFGDFVKGVLTESLPMDLANGIRLHRRIDAFSNQLPGIRRSCDRFPGELRRFAPIFVDVVADYLLANAWNSYHPDPLPHFSATAYAAIATHFDRLPDSGRQFYRHARTHDLFARYGERDTLYGSLRSVIWRLDRPLLADPAIAAVETALPELASDFAGYFPELVTHAAGWLADRGYR
jgi:acyl carrier protein phosphodiesterase